MGFVTITKTPQICKFTMSDCEFFHFFFLFFFKKKCSNSFSLLYEHSQFFCIISRAKYVRFELCVSVWMGRENFKI